MSRIRTFVAVELSPDVIGRCKDAIKRMNKVASDVRWVDPKSIHLTLKFLGDVQDREIHEVCKAVAAATKEFDGFDFACGGIGAFPSLAKPRTIWLGIREGSEQLALLTDRIEEELHGIGYPKERRRFSPHITIGKVREGGLPDEAFLATLESLAEFDGGESDASEVTVFSSELLREGPLYTVLSHAPLKEAWRKKQEEPDEEEDEEDEEVAPSDKVKIDWSSFDEIDEDDDEDEEGDEDAEEEEGK